MTTNNRRAARKAGFSVKGLSKAGVMFGLLILVTVYFQTFFPVAAFEDYSVIESNEDSVILNVSLLKLLDETRIPDSEIWFARADDGRFKQVDGRYINEELSPYYQGSRPKSFIRQDIGLVEWIDNDEIIDGKICHVMWMLQHADGSVEKVEQPDDGFRYSTDASVRFTVLGEFDVC